MDKFLKSELDKLKKECDLSEHDIHKIYRVLPVPSDYNFVWADIKKLNGYPVGVVLTEEAIIIKAGKDIVKEKNKNILELWKNNQNKDHIKKPRKIDELYKIIPWEYYNPEDYQFLINEDDKNNYYSIDCEDSVLCGFNDSRLFNFFKSHQDHVLKSRNIGNIVLKDSAILASSTLNAGFAYFCAKNGFGTGNTGHGFFAEEASKTLDRLSGERSTVIGYDNAPSGPDKLIDGVNVQCKFYGSAKGSVNACFEDGVFRYQNIDGSPMKVEVPKDQYLEAIEIMKKKIKDGMVPGVTDENQAYDIIRESKLTYSQARNLAKAGTIESLTYDIYSGAINCLWAFGISSLVSFCTIFASTKDFKVACEGALKAGLAVYGTSILCSVISSQLARTSFMSAIDGLATAATGIFGTKVAQVITNAYRSMAGLTPIYGAAANSSFKNFLSSNILTTGVMLFVFSLPDTIKVLSKKISKTQYFKNLTVLTVGAATGTLGTIGATALIGSKIGGKFGKGIGRVIGFAGGAIVGTVASIGTKLALDGIREDDGKIMSRMFNALLTNAILDNMLTEDEQNDLFNLLSKDKSNKELKKLFENSLSSFS
ncbi:MAG: hypothetical protein HUJ59_05435, partial [Bacilli bacterium]|nr:hypothetical protein [Bacilli bacterium]